MPLEPLTPRERAVLEALEADRGRVLGRAELARRAGLDALSARRVDAVLVGLRRHVGAELVTVRSRGWMLTRAGADG